MRKSLLSRRPSKLGLTALLAFALVMTSKAQQTIFEIIAESETHTILEAALVEAELDQTLDSEGSYTVFAPNDSSIEAYLEMNNMTSTELLASPMLSRILLHHVVDGYYTNATFLNGELETSSGLDVTVDSLVNITDTTTIDGAKIIMPDILASNGVVHVIDHLLLPTYDDVTEVIMESPDHTILLAALIQADLVTALQAEGPFTVLAPTNAAFEAFLTTNSMTQAELLASDELTDILLHHVLEVAVMADEFAPGEVATLSGRDVTVAVDAEIMIDDATVTNADMMADNGVVHVIDNVLYPSYDDVTEVLTRSMDHTILVNALVEAGLVSSLQTGGPYTVFAPTDAAFTAFLEANNMTATDLYENDSLMTILLHHVVESEIVESEITDGELITMSGADVTVTTGSEVKIDDATITMFDMIAGNGVVHSIDQILIPTYDDVTEVIERSEDHEILYAALIEADLLETLQGEGPYTVFAPTDAAFEAYFTSNNTTAAELLANPNLSEILLHHVYSGSVMSSMLTNGEITMLSGDPVLVDLSSGVMVDAAVVTMADIEAENGIVHVIDNILLPTIVTATEDAIEEELMIYPNPVAATLFTGNSGASYKVIDADGSVVLSGTISSGSISVAGITDGLYALQIVSEGTVSTTTFIKY